MSDPNNNLITEQKLSSLIEDNLSKSFSELMAREALANEEYLGILCSIMLSEKTPHNWRAAWIIDHIQQQSPDMVAPLIPGFLAKLSTIKSDGVKRHILKMATQLSADILEECDVIDICYEWLQSSLTPIANRAHCMEILYILTCKYPDLANELGLVLEEIEINGSKGEKNRAQKILKKIAPWRR